MRPRAACAGGAVERTRVIRSHRNHPAFPAQWFTAYTVLSPVIGFLATVAGGVASTDLTPASRRQDHTSSPSALASPVKRAVASTAPRPASVTFAKRPSEWNRMAMDVFLIFRIVKRKIFARPLDQPDHVEHAQEISFCTQRL